MAKAKGPKGPKQTELKGMERPRDQQIDAAAEDVSEASGKLSKAHALLKERQQRLLELMKKKGLGSYVAQDAKLRVDVTSAKQKVRVSRLEPKEKDGDEDKE